MKVEYRSPSCFGVIGIDSKKYQPRRSPPFLAADALSPSHNSRTSPIRMADLHIARFSRCFSRGICCASCKCIYVCMFMYGSQKYFSPVARLSFQRAYLSLLIKKTLNTRCLTVLKNRAILRHLSLIAREKSMYIQFPIILSILSVISSFDSSHNET